MGSLVRCGTLLVMKQWNFFEKVYRRWIVVMIGPFEEFKQEMIDCKLHEIDTIVDSHGMCVNMNPDNNDTNQNCTFVWLKEYSSATLVHEISHLVAYVFNDVGIPMNLDNTEAFAFYSEYWWAEINRARKKYPNGITPAQAKK